MNYIPTVLITTGLAASLGFDSGLYTQNSPNDGFAQLVIDRSEEISYEEIRLEAINDCKNINPEDVNEELIDQLIEVEKSFNVPSDVRGMLLAAACSESGYNPYAKGDYKFSKSGKKPMAIGLLQLWKWWESTSNGYGVDRTDPIASSKAWMTHIVKKIPKVKRTCKFKSDKAIWVAAWVTAIRKPKKGGRCWEKPLHYKILKKWHKKIHKDRSEQVESGC